MTTGEDDIVIDGAAVGVFDNTLVFDFVGDAAGDVVGVMIISCMDVRRDDNSFSSCALTSLCVPSWRVNSIFQKICYSCPLHGLHRL